ncbi:hypothetical protein LSTR_LSTR005649 [Laodelphax striatellus]|uniref:C2H2-type domain-containing protein n=1 Tax=Laodelphax striatellus TaxID=195883 RepID=A0A482WUP4_LAOST|nr:hypothetical protein LSTR_LSTR005649 [Laodelphax striatellus]
MDHNRLRCRFCGVDCEQRAHVNIFNRNYSFVPLLIEKVFRYFPYMDDGLSKIMCSECLAKMDKINIFLHSSITYLFNSVSEFENSVTKKPCNLCGRVWDHKVNDDCDNITSKVSDLFGYSIAKVRNVCLICVSKVHFYHKFMRMVDSTLSSSDGAEEHTTMTRSNVTVKNEMMSIKQEVDDVESSAIVSNLDKKVEEAITVEIKQEIDISIQPIDIITSPHHPRNSESAQNESSEYKAQKPSRSKKVVDYYEGELSNPDSPDSLGSCNFVGSNSDSEIDDLGSIAAEKASPTPPKNRLVQDLRRFRTLQQPQPSIEETDKPPRRIIINKGEETKPSMNLIFTKKKMNNGSTVTYVSIRSEFIENIKHIKPLLGDGLYYTWNDHIRTNDQDKYKDFVISCIENILQAKANIMPYLKLSVISGVKRLMFTCFICGTTIHNNMIRQAINAHLIMHMVMLCPMCGTFKNSISDMNHHLKTHFKSIYNGKYQCRMCSKEITSGPEVYFTHVMSHFELFNCVKCNYSTNDIECFNKHHDNVCGREDCEGDCSTRYTSHTELMQHLDGLGSGEVVPSFACSNCKMAFHSKELASIHYDIHGHQHSQSERMRNNREEALSVIENLELLQRYEYSRDYDDLEVDDENNCKCPFCSKCLKNTTSAYLNKHINLHILLACRSCENSPIYQEFIHYKNHILFDHTLVAIDCKLCENLKFYNVDLFLSHILQHI